MFIFKGLCLLFLPNVPGATVIQGATLESGINVAPGTFGKNNKHSTLKKHIPLHQITEFRTFFLWITLFNKDIAPRIFFKN